MGTPPNVDEHGRFTALAKPVHTAAGSFGKVYAALDNTTGNIAAIKRLELFDGVREHMTHRVLLVMPHPNVMALIGSYVCSIARCILRSNFATWTLAGSATTDAESSPSTRLAACVMISASGYTMCMGWKLSTGT